MIEKKHIDRLYQEKFREFEVPPNEYVWQNISSRLHHSRKKRRILPLWSRIAGVAAVFTFIFTIGEQFWPSTEITVVETEPNIFEPQEINPSSETRFSIFEKAETVEGLMSPLDHDLLSSMASEEKETIPLNTDKPKLSESREVQQRNFFILQNELMPLFLNSTENILVTSLLEKDQQQPSELKDMNNSLFVLQAEKVEPKAIAETKNDKLRVSTFAAPVYYNGLGTNNVIDQQFADNKQGGEVTMSYGINMAYAVSDKIKVRSGISKVSMSYNTMGISYGSAVDPVALRTVSYNPSAQTIHVQDFKAASATNSLLPEIQDENLAKNPGYLNQRFGFIELPLEVEYALLDNRLGINIIGGASTLFLNENSISINSGEFSTELGESKNLNNVSFSTNIGLGVDYKLSESVRFNLEPMFKYQINTFSSGNFQPFFIGVYSGVSYKF